LIKPVRNRRAREQAEKEVVRNLFLFLDNSRLLQGDHWGTRITDINNSVHQIRSRLGEDIERLDEDSEAARPIREMQAACRECLSQIESLPKVPEGEEVWRDLGVHRRRSAALVELRATCLPRIKQLSEGYGVELFYIWRFDPNEPD
jgi:hypothetical protein